MLLFYNDRASFTTLLELMEKHTKQSKLREHADAGQLEKEEEELKALFYHIELVQLLGE